MLTSDDTARTCAWSSLLMTVLLIGCVPGCATHERRTSASATAEFQSRVAEYMTLHRTLANEGPSLTPSASPTRIQASQETLIAGLQEARREARQGDVFTPAAQTYLRSVIREELRGARDVTDMMALLEVQPASLVVRVNGPYRPDAVPTMPPDLLERLPRLPEELQYRIAHGRLLLLDTHARLIVDFVPDVLPHPRDSGAS